MSDAPEEEFIVLPFYVVCDVSYSMAGQGILGLNQVLPVLRDQARQDPVLSDVVQLGLVTFNSSPTEVTQLGDIGEGPLPTLTASGGTEYGAVLRKIKQLIERDIPRLKAEAAARGERLRVYRPAVFFLSDGGPNDDDWLTAFTELTAYDSKTEVGFKSYPLFVPMGLGGADESVLRQMIHPREHSRLFMVKDPHVDAAVAVTEMAKIMLGTILGSVQSAQAGGIHVFPEQKALPAGIVVYEYDGGNSV